MRYYVKGLSAEDHIQTGPFESYACACHWLRERSSKTHIDKHFSGSWKKWFDFMVKPIPEKKEA